MTEISDIRESMMNNAMKHDTPDTPDTPEQGREQTEPTPIEVPKPRAQYDEDHDLNVEWWGETGGYHQHVFFNGDDLDTGIEFAKMIGADIKPWNGVKRKYPKE